MQGAVLSSVRVRARRARRARSSPVGLDDNLARASYFAPTVLLAWARELAADVVVDGRGRHPLERLAGREPLLGRRRGRSGRLGGSVPAPRHIGHRVGDEMRSRGEREGEEGEGKGEVMELRVKLS